MGTSRPGATKRERIRAVVDLVTPPLASRVARRVRRSGDSEWEYVGTEWPAGRALRGWNVASVVASQRSAWRDLESTMRGEDLVARDVVAHNTRMCFAYVLGVASVGRSAVSLLDWGGGLGQYGLIARGLYPEVEIDYHCRDLPLMAEAGRELLPDATFYDSDRDALARTYDLVVASSALHYTERWTETLATLAAASRNLVFVTRQPFAEEADSFVVLQRPRDYNTEYVGWVLNRQAFLARAMSLGLGLRREFVTGERPHVPGAPEQPVYRGFLFQRADS